MGFFNAMRRLIGSDREVRPEQQRRLREAWGLDDERTAAAAPAPASASGRPASEYDREHWVKKLRKVLGSLPESKPDWEVLMTEAHGLGFEEEWIARHQLEEFTFLIRQAVADRVVSEREHESIEAARLLIGLTEAEAVDLLHRITAEAESFFGAEVRDEG